MLTNTAHVLGVACRSVCKIWSFQVFALSWGSQRRPPTRRSSCFHTFPLETEYSSSTTEITTTYYRVWWLWPFPFRRLAMSYLEHQGSRWICFFQRNRDFKLKYPKKLFDTNNIFCSRRYMERSSISRLFKCWLHDLRFFGTFFMKTKTREDRLSAFTETFYLKKLLWHIWLLVKAVTTFWKYSPSDTTLFLSTFSSNLHLLLDNNAAGCILFTRTGFLIQMGWALYWVTSTSVIPEEGRFYFWNQTFTNGDPRKIAMFHSFFPHVLEIAQPDYTRRDSSALGIIRTLSRIDRIFLILNLGAWFSMLLPCHWKPGELDHSEWSRSSTSRHSKAHTSRTPEQTYSQLDVQTSHFLLPSATASRPPQVLSWSVLCARRV